MDHHILVIEDNLEMQDLLSLLLTQEGYQVISATTGKAALEILKLKPKLSIILLDLTLPDMKSEFFLDEMKKNSPEETAPILFFSAVPNLNKMILPSGVLGVIQKPFQIQSFLETIANFKKTTVSMHSRVLKRAFRKKPCCDHMIYC